ncbi:MAG: hypothetical protein H0Z35_10640 [Thermoanaerobacteraceae bacterium]|nr:hypothetical protein [Thermoanaerobacteraceae bacterium]
MGNTKTVTWIIICYCISLVSILAYGLYTYGHLKGVEPLDHTMEFVAYKEFLTVTSVVLGVQLGIFAAMLGHIYKNISLSFISLFTAITLTTIVYLALPKLFFPYGAGLDFQAWLVWMTTGPIISIGVLLILCIFIMLNKT